jgi:hypothetical protein
MVNTGPRTATAVESEEAVEEEEEEEEELLAERF